MDIPERQEGDVIAIEMAGRMMYNMDPFLDRLCELRDTGHVRIVLNLYRVRLINSDGIGVLIAGMKKMRAAGGDVKLANLSDRARMLLVDITGLDTVFDISDTEEEAIERFVKPPAIEEATPHRVRT